MSVQAPASEGPDPGHGPTVAELSPGQDFRGTYACLRKDRLTARNGSPFLALDLRDRTGSIAARLFREVDRIGSRFERGDAIRVSGRVEQFRGQVVAELEEVQKLDPGQFDPAEFLPASYRNRDELEGFLEHLTREVHNADLRQVVETVLQEGETAERFRQAPCTRTGHHSYLGGLLEHTVAVATLAVELCTLHPRLNSDLLIAASLLHDVGKTREFTYGAEFGISEEGRMLGHLQLGSEILSPALTALEPGLRAALLSCVLCHHGTDALRLREFPSPEAIALYRLNALDAQVKGVLERG